jgi:hypothetical protein
MIRGDSLQAYLWKLGAKPLDPAIFAEHERSMREEVIPKILADLKAARRAAHFARLGIPDPWRRK